MTSKHQYAYVQVQDFHEDPKCPDCWRGRLTLDSMNSYWVCNAGFTKCGRRYRRVQIETE